MSKYSTTASTFSTSAFTSGSDFDDYTKDSKNSEASPTSVNTVISITSPPSSPQSPDSSKSIFSLLKKRENVNSVNNSTSSKPQQQLVVPANISRHNNKDTTEEITDHSVSQSVIGSVSVPNLTASNTDLETLMKQQQVSGSNSDVSYGLGSGIDNSLDVQPKKSGRKKGNSISSEKNDDKGFKNTMKNTMRKTSTFFKKLGNKQNSDSQSQQSSRPPLPNFQDSSNSQKQTSEEPQNVTSSTINVTNTEEFRFDTANSITLSDNDDDLEKSIQNALSNLHLDGEDRRRSGLYRMSLIGGNKSVPDNIGRTYEWNEQTLNDVQLKNEDSNQECLDRRNSSNTIMSLPVIRSEMITIDLEQVKEEGFEKIIQRTKPRSVSGTYSGLSPSTIPKRPSRKLPDIPKNITKPESDVSQSRSPHTRQDSSITSSYSEGSTSTLHTAPPSPITDAETNYVTDGVSQSPIDGIFGSSLQEISGKSEDEVLWAKAKALSKKCFEEEETFTKKEEITKHLGGHELISSRALKCYMDYFDFSNLRLDVAFRRLCGKLYIKGETQQVDRILEAFSVRYWKCNPKTIYGSSDIVHAIAYSILLLNTDLHIAQVASKMSRSQFVRNTMATVHHTQASMAAQNINESYEDDQSTITSIETSTTGTSAATRPRRSGSIKSWRSNPNSSLTNLSFMPGGFSRQWDSEIQNLLKDMYSAIKSNQILQPVSPSTSVEQPNMLSPGLHRSRSHLGHPNSRINALKIGGNSKVRKNVNGRISPSPSSVSGGSDSSIGIDSLNRSGSSQTLPTTLSSFSLRHASSSENSAIPEMVDENGPDDDSVSIVDSVSTSESLELYLSGAPYAKEGLLVRKQYWESTSKRAKDKGWKECFVIVEKGEIRMYKFETSSSQNSMGIGAIGGGNWMTNAILLGEVNLRHTITNALPPPGYNRSRPHVFALSMPNGGLYFFQAGTAELVNEWVVTCNYWAACKSKEPLTGGVSSMEYGWGRCLDNVEDWEDSRSDVRSVTSGNSTNISDRIIVSEWKQPLPPTVSSNFDEETQLAALVKYRADLESELEEHKNFWEPMTKLFNPRSSNYTKALSNWEKKSQWLLYEIVKYTTYIECINNSINIRAGRLKEKGKLKNNNEDGNSSLAQTDEEAKKEKLRAKARQSIKFYHRATWTPGGGPGLNLPKELFENLEDDGENPEVSLNKLNGKSKSSTYPLPNDKKAVIEEEIRIGSFNNVDYETGHKWVDRFA